MSTFLMCELLECRAQSSLFPQCPALYWICVAAAAKSLQSCLTLCDPIDGSPPGSSVHGIFQARVLEWGAIAFSVGYVLGTVKCTDSSKLIQTQPQVDDTPAQTDKQVSVFFFPDIIKLDLLRFLSNKMAQQEMKS